LSRPRPLQRLKSAGSAQKFLSTHAAVFNTSNVPGHLTSAQTYRTLRAAALSTCREAAPCALRIPAANASIALAPLQRDKTVDLIRGFLVWAPTLCVSKARDPIRKGVVMSARRSVLVQRHYDGAPLGRV
jgi:hypothetical protein